MVMQTGKVNALLQVLNTAQLEWEFSFPTGPPLIPSWLEGQKGLITAGWWSKSWSLWGFVWQHPIPIRKGKALPVPGRDGSPGFLCGPPWHWEGGGGDNMYVCHLVGMKTRAPSLSFSDATLASVGVPWYTLLEGWSLGFPLGLSWHEWE